MARDRERLGRAAERERAARQQRLIYIGSGVVLGVAALLILAGLYVTRYLPPRAHVVTVGDESYQARDIVDRGYYLAFFERGVSSAAQIARETVDRLIEEEALRLRGPDLVETVTAEDVQREVQIDLGLIVDDPEPEPDGEPTPEATDTATATVTPTPDPTPEPTVDPQEFADALTEFLRNSQLDRDEYEAIVEARLYRDRLRDHFEAEVGGSGPQLFLRRIRVSTQLAADSVIEELEGGADFETLAEEESVAEEDGPGGEIGWTVASVQDDDVEAAIEGLGAGEWSEAIETGLFFEIYLVAETAEDREYESALVSALTSERLDEWIAEAIESVEVDEDLSTDEESWINERVLAG